MRLVPFIANVGAIAAGLAIGTGLRPAHDVPMAAVAAEKVPSGDRAGTDDPAAADAAPSVPEAVTAYEFDFRRPFIVPVSDGWRTSSLIVIDVALSVGPQDDAAAGRMLETRLRDAILPALLRLGREGGLASHAYDQATVEAAIADAAAPILPDGAPGVTVEGIDRRRV